MNNINDFPNKNNIYNNDIKNMNNNHNIKKANNNNNNYMKNSNNYKKNNNNFNNNNNNKFNNNNNKYNNNINYKNNNYKNNINYNKNNNNFNNNNNNNYNNSNFNKNNNNYNNNNFTNNQNNNLQNNTIYNSTNDNFINTNNNNENYNNSNLFNENMDDIDNSIKSVVIDKNKKKKQLIERLKKEDDFCKSNVIFEEKNNNNEYTNKGSSIKNSEIYLKNNPSINKKKLEENLNYKNNYENKNDVNYIDSIVEKINNYKLTINQKEFEKYELINDFSSEKIFLSDLEHFKNLIDNEPDDILFHYRQSNFISKKYLSNQYYTLKSEFKTLLELMSFLDENYNELIDKNYQMNKNINLYNNKTIKPNYSQNVNKIFGNLDNLESFIYNFDLINEYEIMLFCYKYFNYWRQCKNDGNSFYRIFMFLYIEYFILNKNVEKLKILIKAITEKNLIDYYKSYNINLNNVFEIFKIILFFMENKKDVKSAYKEFLNAYNLEDNSFDLTLILYLRKIVHTYMNKLIKLYQKREETDIKIINLESILTLNVEPDILVIILMPYIFDVNLVVLFIEGDYSAPKKDIINLYSQDESGLPLIIIGNFYNNYYPLYSRSNKEIIYYDFNKFKNMGIKKLICFGNKFKCNDCNNENNQIIFLEKKKKVCAQCLKNFLSDTINELANNFYKEAKCYSLEYYLQPIFLKDNIFINNFEFKEIYKNKLNMFDAIYNVLENICFNCHKTFKSNELILMKCKCKFCKRCLEKKINEYTSSHKLLNVYEKKTFKKIKCCCNKDFDYDNAKEYIEFTQEEIDKAAERLYDFIYNTCCICLKSIKDNPSLLYKPIKIEKENDGNYGIDFNDMNHILCKKCYISIHKQKHKKTTLPNKIKPTEDDLKNNENFISCNICDKIHRIRKELNDDDEEIKGNYCSGCLIL